MPVERQRFLLNHHLHRIMFAVMLLVLIPTMVTSFSLHRAFAVTRTWDGGGTDGTCGGAAGDGNKWSCAANWSADTVPVAGDAVVFDATSTKDSTIDASFAGTITSLSINAGYTGTITMARSLTMSATYTQAAGTFVQGAQTLTIGGNFAHTAGTFTPNTGTVVLTGTTPTVSGATTFNNFYVATTGNSDVTLTLPASTTTTVTGVTRLLSSVHNDPAMNKLTVVSSSSGVQSSVDFQGTLAIFNAHIKDLNNINATQIHCYASCVDDGNTTNIRFGEPGFARTAVTGNVTEAGSTATFTVALRGKPTASVTIPLSSSDITEATVSPSSLTFTTGNYTTPQTVTVTGVDDGDDDGGIASSIVLGAATSSDTLYSGLNSVDMAVYTEDNDAGFNTIDFDSDSTLLEEDVKGTVAWFDQTNQGEGTFKTGSGGTAVNLSLTKIQPGCRATIGGVDYTIVRLSPSTTGQVLLTNGVTLPNQIYLTLTDAAVTKISCFTKPTDAVALGGSAQSIVVSNLDFGTDGYGEARHLIDADNNRIWVVDPSGSPAFYGVSMTTGLLTSTKVLTESQDVRLALDPTRDVVWAAEYVNNDVVIFDATTGDYAFGTLGASSFAVPGHPWDIAYNPELDEFWVLRYGDDSVSRVNASTHAITATISLSGYSPNSLAYDSTQHAMWISVDDGARSLIVKMSATTGTFANSTFDASSYPIPGMNASGYDSMFYDSERNVLWESTYRQPDNIDSLNKIDASTGSVLGTYETSAYSFSSLYAAGDQIYLAGSRYLLSPAEGSSAEVIIFDATTGERLTTYPTTGSLRLVALENDGTLWTHNSVETELDKSIIGAPPDSAYYSVTTTASSNVDVTGSPRLTRADATDDADGANIFYSVSFDGRNSYKVRVNNVWRVIASNKASDHGGTDGNWYYRNDASTWTAASTNTPTQALSLAVENGVTNNRMTTTALEAMQQGAWQDSGGFSTATDSIDLGVTLYTTSFSATPSVDAVVFTLATGSGSTTPPSGGGETPPPPESTPEPIPEPTPIPPPIIFPEGTGLLPGDFVRTEDSSAVYFITPQATRRAFLNAATFFTYMPNFSTVKFVADTSVAAFSIDEPMPPKPGTVLIKTPSSDKVYAFASTATVEHPEIRWLPTEAVAKVLYGKRWADYVIDLDQAAFDRLPVGPELLDSDAVDTTQLLRRMDLAKRVRDFLKYARVHMTSLVPWAEKEKIRLPWWSWFSR